MGVIEPFLELATLLAEEAHGPQRWAWLGREELPIPNRLAADGVGDIIGAQPNPVHPWPHLAVAEVRHRRINKCGSDEVVATHCQRPRRGYYGPRAHAHLTPQWDNVARLSCLVSSRSEDITQ